MIITTKEQIINRKIILIQKGKTGPVIAKEIGCSAPTVFLAIAGKTQSILRHRQIAEALGVPMAEFWPEFYGPINANAENIVHQDVDHLTVRGS